MKSSDFATGRGVRDRAELGDYVEAFERTQERGPAALAAFLPPAGHPLYPAVLRELIRVDLEYSFQKGRPHRLEDYRPLYPEAFRDKGGLEEITFEEFRLRLQAGEDPTPSEYRQRFGVDATRWPGREVGPARLTGPGAEVPLGSRDLPGRPRSAFAEGSSAVRAPGRKGKDLSAVVRDLLPNSHRPRPDTAWDVLDRFLRTLQGCDQGARQVRLTLEAICESTGADTAYWYGGDGEPVERVGGPGLDDGWCRDFARRLLAEADGRGPLLRPVLPPAPDPADPSPHSALLVPVGRSRTAWLVALTFHPGRRFGPTDVKVVGLARRMLLHQRQHIQTAGNLKEALFGLVRCLTVMIDSRDPYTCGHSERVARMAVRLGQQLGLQVGVVSDLYLAGLLHDIGKIGIRDEVLRKPGELTPEETAHVRTHVTIGDRIVSTIKHFVHLRPGVRNHHERYDGQGYPDGLAGNDIPLLARVLAVADSCDAMTSARPYRPALPRARIDDILRDGAGRQWDPEVVAAFLACRPDLYSICQQGIGDSVAVAVGQVLDAGGDDSLRGPGSSTVGKG